MQRKVLRTESEGGNWIENIRGERKAKSDASSGDQILYSVKRHDSKWQKELTVRNFIKLNRESCCVTSRRRSCFESQRSKDTREAKEPMLVHS